MSVPLYSVYANEKPYATVGTLAPYWGFAAFYWEGDELCLVGEVRLVAPPVFVESCDNGVAVVGDVPVYALFCRREPVGTLFHGIGIGAETAAHVEVAVTECLCVAAGAHPVVIHAEGTHHHALVVASQIVVDGFYPSCLQFHEHRIDNLHDVVAPQTGHDAEQTGDVGESAKACRLACEVDVARIVFPEIAVGHDCHFMTEGSQSLGKGPVHVAVFAEEQYFHRFIAMKRS